MTEQRESITFDQLGVSVAVNSTLCVVAIALFGCAVKARSIFIAPRATARPRNVIYNPDPKHPCQNRGNAWLGWIPWTLGLSYETMLKGVPGTGTRKGGLGGDMLKVQLDAVVMLRFHAMGARITALITFLCISIIMPLFLSAQCFTESEMLEPQCQLNMTNMTDYERTTIQNVPPINYTEQHQTIIQSNTARLYAVSFIFWIVLIYTVQQLKQEWIHIIAMRRVYYLEHDIWGERREEHKQTLLYAANAKKEADAKRHFTFEDGQDKKHANKDIEDIDEERLANRDPWTPHPEQRDTVPNVFLYSVLVGNLPALPKHAADTFDEEAVINFSKRDNIDWLLSITTTFFDHCVPNQPGFSSSVAAVTIVPEDHEISLAWKKWYTAAGKLRRLRFIRELIEEKRHYDIACNDDSDMPDDGKDDCYELDPVKEGSIFVDTLENLGNGKYPIASGKSAAVAEGKTPTIYSSESLENKAYFYEVHGRMLDEAADSRIFEIDGFGPEQTAVYSREFAQSAAPCCPRGCHEGRVRRAGIDELQELEQITIAEVHEANIELKKVRLKAARISSIPAKDTFVPAETAARAKPTLDGIRLPSDFQLESELYTRSSTNGLKAKEKSVALETPRSSTPPRTSPGAKGAEKITGTTDSEPANEDLLPTHFEEEDSLVGAGRSEWDLVQSIVGDFEENRTKSNGKLLISSGVWDCPCPRIRPQEWYSDLKEWATKKSSTAVDKYARDSTFAVVTFTSRQAAVAARHCLADGRGAERWNNLKDLPIPPLADAASCDICVCRNCCRPVTLSINERQKKLRYWFTMALLGTIYVFTMVALTYISNLLLNPTNINLLCPPCDSWIEENFPFPNFQVTNALSGWLTSLFYMLFFAVCPILFKTIANFGSNATSVANAEFAAMQYYWWFIVGAMFFGSTLTNFVLAGVTFDADTATATAKTFLESLADTIPTTISATWINWILLRFLVILPYSYLLQINTFLFAFLGMPCCARCVRGGGPGGPIPYRIYIDGGTVFICALAIAPQAPLIAPLCFIYFIFSQPMLRRNVIYMYRPKFDGGGHRWPFLFDMVITSMLVGQVLLIMQMSLKKAIGPTIVAAIPIVPILIFRSGMRKRFLAAFEDAALMQTSLLDGWDVQEKTTEEQREDFRRFLVDAHKAAYIPICLAGTDTDQYLTAEPAVVVPLESDPTTVAELGPPSAKSFASAGRISSMKKPQRGATMRRAPASVRMSSSRRFGFSPGDFQVGGEEVSLISPFARNTSAKKNHQSSRDKEV